MSGKKKSIPDGWLPVTPVGKPVSGTRFLAFKVPLKQTLNDKMHIDDQFSPAILLSMEPNLRLIIDLTNTSRYYDYTEFTDYGVYYEKIFCPGRQIPDKKLMHQFFRIVDNFMQSEDTEDKFIGVHCTHGINRTGYFICNYMIQRMGFTPEKAISTFQEARGHEIVRDYFIEELSSNYKKKLQFEKQQKKAAKKQQQSGGKQQSSNQQFNNRFRGNRPGPSGAFRGKHHSHPQSHHRGHHHRNSFGQQSQLNYYEEENNTHKRFHKNKNFRGKHQWHNPRNSNNTGY